MRETVPLLIEIREQDGLKSFWKEKSAPEKEFVPDNRMRASCSDVTLSGNATLKVLVLSQEEKEIPEKEVGERMLRVLSGSMEELQLEKDVELSITTSL